MTKKFVIVCGGTGGHLAPGIAIAEGLTSRGHTVTLLISRKEVDSRLVAKYKHLHYERIEGAPFSVHPIRALQFGWGCARGIWQTFKLLRKLKPDVVLAFGGFISVSAGFATLLMHIPLALHEANRRPGKANRLLAKRADLVFLPRGMRVPGLSPKKMRDYGYPVRKEIRRQPREQALAALGLEGAERVLAVIGGSQGAAALNRWVRDNFEALGARGIETVCITGPRAADEGLVEVPVGDRVARARFLPFSDNMAAIYSAADLVVSRAGAGTLAELIRCHTPAVLVPYPYATDDHQTANARFLEQRGGAIILQQSHLSNLRAEVLELIFNDDLLDRFKQNLSAADFENRLGTLLDELEHLAGMGTRPAPVKPLQAG